MLCCLIEIFIQKQKKIVMQNALKTNQRLIQNYYLLKQTEKACKEITA
jgi:hypothetical protein